MKPPVFLTIVAVLFAAISLPTAAIAQSTNVKTPNKNQSAKFKSGIFKGSGNLIESNSIASFIGGGQSNVVSINLTTNAAIVGGFGNVVSSDLVFVGGGLQNFIPSGATYACVVGGRFNMNSGFAAFIGAGEGNTASTNYATVGGGRQNRADGNSAMVGGGGNNTAQGDDAFVGGGFLNTAEGSSATIGGGRQNTANGARSFVGGGEKNFISSTSLYATLGGGYENTASGDNATVVGGLQNTNHGEGAFIGGGRANKANATNSTISGGFSNTITEAAIGAVIGGGTRNTNNGANATIPGGIFNKASGNNSFAAGATAGAEHDASFVWGDGSALTTSIGTNSFTVRATGGAKIFTTAGSQLTSPDPSIAAGGADWQSSSDSNLKTGVTAVDHRAVLAKLAAMPVTSWQFKHDKARRYIGPMAQDFHAVFGLGSSDKTIGTLDANGVLFSSIKGLVEELKDRDKKHAEDLAERDETIEELKSKLRAVEERLDSLPPAP